MTIELDTKLQQISDDIAIAQALATGLEIPVDCPPQIDNVAPVIGVIAAQTVNEGDTVAINANITDTDGTYTVLWSQIEGTAVTIVPSGDNMSFIAPMVTINETLLFEVTVTDNDGAVTVMNADVFVIDLPVVVDPPPPVNANTIYISPIGNNSNNGSSISLAVKTFAQAFSLIPAGGELILLDGTYGSANGTIHFDTAKYPNSGQIASGISKTKPSIIRALNPGMVKINNPVWIGTKTVKHSFVECYGINSNEFKFYNTHYCKVKNSGISGILVNGTRDHSMGNTFNLIEDCWAWASGYRVLSLNMRADDAVWRRVILRGDGCNASKCLGSGNPNFASNIYDSSRVSLQNCFVVDRVLGGGRSYTDFGTAQHASNTANVPLGLIEWIGCASVNSEDNGFVLEADNVLPNVATWSIKDCLVLGGKRSALIMGKQNWVPATPNVLKNFTALLDPGSTVAVDGIRFNAGQNISAIDSVLISGAGRDNMSSASNYTNVASFNPARSHYKYNRCPTCPKIATSLVPADPLQATSNGVTGATIINKIGIDGSRYGDAGFNSVTANPLWPYPNEDRIKTEMSVDSTRGFCAAGQTLSIYIRNFKN